MTWFGGDCCVPRAYLQKREYDCETGKACHQNENRGRKRQDGQEENDLKRARYLLRPLGVIEVEIDGGKIDSNRKRGNRVTDEDKGNKTKKRNNRLPGPESLIFVFADAVHVFSITSSQTFWPGMAGEVTDRRLMFWGEMPTRTFRSPATLTRIR